MKIYENRLSNKKVIVFEDLGNAPMEPAILWDSCVTVTWLNMFSYAKINKSQLSQYFIDMNL